MRKFVLGIALFYMVGMLVYAQPNDLYKPISISEMNNFNIIGTVQIQIDKASTSMNGTPSVANKEEAYIRLLAEAKKTYQRYDIDIRNISVINTTPLRWRPVTLIANGDVVVPTGKNATIGLEGAVNKICESLIYDLPKNKTIAVLSVSSRDRNTATFVVEEIEFQLVDSKEFKVVDRATLDKIRTEQNFQLSGEVDDRSAVSIGKLLGANIVITGSVSGSGSSQRITIKALDVQTAQIITMARESF